MNEKPEPRTVRLESKDIPPGSVIRDPDWDDGEYEMILSVFSERVYTSTGQRTYKALMEDKWVIRYPGADKWLLCSKQSV